MDITSFLEEQYKLVEIREIIDNVTRNYIGRLRNRETLDEIERELDKALFDYGISVKVEAPTYDRYDIKIVRR